jgi:two-component system KDP operon response regulator KdpE
MNVLIIGENYYVLRDLELCLRVRWPQAVIKSCAREAEALEVLQGESPDLVILDSSITGVDGLDLIGSIRQFSDAVLIMLTEQGTDLQKMEYLEAGADDYLDKPFNPVELLARVRALMRRVREDGFPEEHQLSVGKELTVDLSAHQVLVSNKRVRLTPTEYKVLVKLARNNGRLVTYQTLLNDVWGGEYGNDVTLIKKYVYRLRSKLKLAGNISCDFACERGIGYRLSVQN